MQGLAGVKSCPVDFNHESPEHAANWPDRMRTLREECPRAWTDAFGGFWVATRYKDILRIAQAPDDFGTAKAPDPATGEMCGGVTIPGSPVPATIPLETDNPEWRGYRHLLNPRFAPKAAEQRRTIARGIARTLIDRVIETGRMDMVLDLTNPLPAIFTMDLLGFDLDNWRDFADPVHKFVYWYPDDPGYADVISGIEAIRETLTRNAVARQAEPRDDLLSYIANTEVDGRKLEIAEVIQTALLIIFGGVDTTTSLTSNVLIHLSRHPDQRRRLIEDPSLIPVAREEFLRYFSPIHGMARNARRDVDLDGWRIDKGDRVLLAYSSANRDPEIFDDPEDLRIDRFPNRHVSFGAGMHRCIGSFFARVMFEAMLDEVLTRLPDYSIVEDQLMPYPSVGRVNGWINIPATFTPGSRLGGGISL